jgi:hypothetical protein
VNHQRQDSIKLVHEMPVAVFATGYLWFESWLDIGASHLSVPVATIFVVVETVSIWNSVSLPCPHPVAAKNQPL